MSRRDERNTRTVRCVVHDLVRPYPNNVDDFVGDRTTSYTYPPSGYESLPTLPLSSDTPDSSVPYPVHLERGRDETEEVSFG